MGGPPGGATPKKNRTTKKATKWPGLVAVLNQVLSRAGRDEQAMMTTLAGLVVVLMMVVREIASLFDLVKSLFGL